MQKTQELKGGSSVRFRGKHEISGDGAEEYDGKRREDKKNKYWFGAQVACKPNNNCKVCKYFESHPKKLRGSRTLFAEHYGIGPGGCPRFVELDIGMRREVVKEMKICNRVLSTEILSFKVQLMLDAGSLQTPRKLITRMERFVTTHAMKKSVWNRFFSVTHRCT